MMRKTILKLFFIVSLFLFNGCFLWTTRDDGELLKQEVQHLKDRVTKLEDDTGKNQKKLSEMIDHAQQEVKSLEETLTKATRVLARNSADFGAEMETVKDQIMKFEGGISEIKHDLSQMQKNIDKTQKKINEFALAAGLDLPIDESAVPKTAKEHFNAINRSMSAGRYGEVRSLARLYLKRYPKDRRCDMVQLAIGRSYINQRRYSKALGALRLFTDKYPKSRHMAEALYEMANAFFKLGVCTDAKILIDTILKRYKSSPFAKKAAILKQTIDSSKSRCTS
jgi:TolA-binding protein